MPLGGTNSAVISAACHVRYESTDTGEETDEVHIANKALMWGVTIPNKGNEVGHCSFSDGHVEQPEVSHLYTGMKKENSS